VPAVIVVTLSEPVVAVEPVKPAPIVIVFELEYLKITTPDPPFFPGVAPPTYSPPPPPPVFQFH